MIRKLLRLHNLVDLLTATQNKISKGCCPFVYFHFFADSLVAFRIYLPPRSKQRQKKNPFAFLLYWWEQQGYKMKEILLLKAEVAVEVEEGRAFQHVNFLKFFCRKTCILQYPRMVSKAWQKTFKWSGLSRRMQLINFDKFNLLFPIQAQVSSTLFGGGICSSSPCNLLRANMNNTQLGYQGPYYLEWCIKHQHCTVKISSTLVRIEKANCIFVWDPANLLPGESVLIASR